MFDIWRHNRMLCIQLYWIHFKMIYQIVKPYIIRSLICFFIYRLCKMRKQCEIILSQDIFFLFYSISNPYVKQANIHFKRIVNNIIELWTIFLHINKKSCNHIYANSHSPSPFPNKPTVQISFITFVYKFN